MDEKKQIEIRSNEVQEILGGVPSRLIRYGVAAIFVVFILILIGSWLFRYPDIIRSKIVVTTERPPAIIIARATGKIEKLLVEDNQQVKAGTIIAQIENPASYENILKLKNGLAGISSFFIDYDINNMVVFDKGLRMGAIQGVYSTFIKKYNDYLNFLELDYYPRLNKSLDDQKKMSRIYYERLWTQKDILNNDFELANKQFRRDSSLFSNSIISSKDFEKSKSEMLKKKYEFEGVRSSLAEMQLRIIELDQKIIENEKNHQDQKTTNELELNEAYNNLIGAVSEWELNYILTAPVDGTVTFNKFWSETQNVKEGDKVLTIIPENPGDLVGKVQLPVRGSGKVKIGLNVNVKFDNYPYMEYGMVNGVVKNISIIPEDNFYMAEIVFPDGLVTNYGRTLEMQNEVVGQAEIITEKLRLIQRFFNPLKSLWKERINNKE